MADEQHGDSPAGNTENNPPSPIPAQPAPEQAEVGGDTKQPTEEKEGKTLELIQTPPLIEILTLFVQASLAVIAVFALCIYQGQLKAMMGQLDQMKSASAQTAKLLDLYKEQLAQLTKQAGDTHDLAVAAGKQAAASKQAAKSSLIQAITAQKSEALLAAQIMPNVILQKLELTEPLSSDHPVQVMNTYINEGGSVAYDVQARSTQQSIIDGSAPVWEFKEISGSTVSVPAQNTFNNPDMFVPPIPPIQLAQIHDGSRKFYILGEVIYSDFTHKIHHNFYCGELVLNSPIGYFRGCKYTKPSD
jgi:hypothetical protein